MKPLLRRTLLAAAVALAALPAAAEPAKSPFTQTVFFGDSLTDGGYFRPVLIQLVGPNGAVLGRFTTNPGLVWAQYLAEHYGTNAMPAWTGNNTGTPTPSTGSNWAVGGARVGVDAVGGLGYTPSLATQYARYLAAGNSVDPGALYTVWGGANDMFAVQANPAQAQQIIGGAVTAQIGLVTALTRAGAQYILVPTLPDLGLTPDARAGGAAAMGQGTALATSYNNALFNGLASAGLRVIPLDTFRFLQEVAANPAAFGLTNVTGRACLAQPAPAGGSSLFCNPLSTVAGGANSHLFADGVHPTTAGHRALADFAISVIDGPRQVAVLPHSAATAGRARARMVEGSFTSFKAVDGLQWWAGVRGDKQRYDDPIAFDGPGLGASFGIGRRSGNLVYGAFAAYGRQDIDFGSRRGSFEQTDAGLGGYLGWTSGGFWANAQLGWTSLDFDVERQVNIGQATRVHRGSPGGDNLSLAGTAGWTFRSGPLSHGPVLSMLAQRITVEGFDEDSTQSTALSYPGQDHDSLVGSMGWQMEYRISDRLSPYARLTLDREFEGAPAQAWARSRSMPGTLPYAVPGLEFDQSYGNLSYGTRSQLFGLHITTGSSLSIGRKGGRDTSFFLAVSGSL